jgi:hypothetical protein
MLSTAVFLLLLVARPTIQAKFVEDKICTMVRGRGAGVAGDKGTPYPENINYYQKPMLDFLLS